MVAATPGYFGPPVVFRDHSISNVEADHSKVKALQGLLSKEVTPGDDASTDRPVKSETNSLEQLSNHGRK
jgi:hypothetical protein